MEGASLVEGAHDLSLLLLLRAGLAAMLERGFFEEGKLLHAGKWIAKILSGGKQNNTARNFLVNSRC